MIKSIFYFLIIIPLLFSCYNEGGNDVKKPETFLSFDEMIEILTDIQIAEGIITHNRSIHENNTDKFRDSLYSKIFHHYGITATAYRENLNYYNDDPSVMEEMFDLVLANLSKEQSQIQMEASIKEEDQEGNEESEDEITKSDSIKR